MWIMFKVFIEFVTTWFLFHDLIFFVLSHVEFNSLTRNQNCNSCTGKQSHNHWTTTEAPVY